MITIPRQFSQSKIPINEIAIENDHGENENMNGHDFCEVEENGNHHDDRHTIPELAHGASA